MQKKVNGKSTFFFLALILIVSIFSSCSAPTYDAKTDELISNAQREIDQYIVHLVSLRRGGSSSALREASFDQNTKKYDRFDSDITALEMRMTAQGDISSERLRPTFERLRSLLASFRATHQQTPGTVLSEPYLIATRNQFNVVFQTLLSYELTKKTGQKPT